MRILRAKLTNYRGTAHREIQFGPRVTIIEGPNEVGKSSIAEALDLLFRFKDSSKHSAVKATFPVDRDESPEVEFEIESGPYRFTYRKQFGKGSKTELEVSQPKPENFTGDAAHERAEQILAETLDVALWRALQVDQGVGIEQADLTDSAALGRALDHASGSTASGSEEGVLFERVEREHARYFTPTGREKAELTDGKKKIDELENDLAELEEKLRALWHDVEEHDRLADRLLTLEEQTPGLEKDLGNREKAWEEVSKLHQQAERAAAEVERLELDASRLMDAKTRREGLVNKLGESEARSTKLGEAHAAVLEPLEKLRTQVKAAKDDRTRARSDLQEAEALHKLSSGDEKYLRAKLEAARLEERHTRVVDIREKVRHANRILETNQVTDDELQRIIDADIEVRQLGRRLEEAGPQISARALSDVTILVDGETVDLEKGVVDERAIARMTTITIPDRLELTVTPGASAEDLEELLQAAARARDSLLDEHTLDSIKAARSANSERNQAQRDLAEAESRVQENLRDLTFERLEASRDSCLAVVEEHEATRAEEPPVPDKLATARELAGKAETRVTEAREREREAADHAADLVERVEVESSRDARLAAQIEAEGETTAALTAELESARQELPDDELNGTIATTESEAGTAQILAASLRAKLDGENPDQVEARKDSARAALEAGRQERAEVRETLKTVEGRLEVQQEAGLFEETESVRSKLDQAQSSHSRLERRASAARLLYTILSSHRDTARARYLEPLTSRIEALGRMVFDTSFRVTLADDLTIESRTLEGQTIPFDSLSKGAQEQLGLLARLAVAMIVSADEGVPLILDDTLVYSDPSRMETMAATIARAAECCQVVILTCSPDRFRGIPGAQVERLTPGS